MRIIMKPVFDVISYKYPNTCMQCDNLEQAITFARYLDSRGLYYASGESYLNFDILLNAWSWFSRPQLCFYFNHGTLGTRFSRSNTKTLIFDDFNWTNHKETELYPSVSDEVAMLDFLRGFKII